MVEVVFNYTGVKSDYVYAIAKRHIYGNLKKPHNTDKDGPSQKDHALIKHGDDDHDEKMPLKGW
jgi:hypothetical protein